MAAAIDEVVGGPVLVAVRLPGGVAGVQRDRVVDAEPAHRAADVGRVGLEGELRRVDAYDGQAPAAVLPVERLEPGQRAQAVDAGVGPEVQQHHAAPQGGQGQRVPAGVEPGRDPAQRRGGPGVGQAQVGALGVAPTGGGQQRRRAGGAVLHLAEARPHGTRALEGLQGVRVGRGVAQHPGGELGVQAEEDDDAGRHHHRAEGLADARRVGRQAPQRRASSPGEQQQGDRRADGVGDQHHHRGRRGAARGGRGGHRGQDGAGARRPDEPEGHAHEEPAGEPRPAHGQPVAQARDRAQQPAEPGVGAGQDHRQPHDHQHGHRRVALRGGADADRAERRGERQREQHEAGGQPDRDPDGAGPAAACGSGQHHGHGRQHARRQRRRHPRQHGEEGQHEHRRPRLGDRPCRFLNGRSAPGSGASRRSRRRRCGR